MAVAALKPTQAVGRDAGEVLAWGRSLLDPALRDAVNTLPASIRRVVAYHLGWCDQNGLPAKAGTGGGKAVRPTLALLAAEACGLLSPEAVDAAAAVELVHNYSLLHDDVMDGDRTRRHRPTAWTVFGPAPAILAGDGLLGLAFQVLARTGHPAASQGMLMLGDTLAEMVDGQHADVSFPTRARVGLTECIDMSAKKTGALIACACALGSAFGGGTPEQVRRFWAFGAHLGLAFQLVDDMLAVWGDPAVTGKPSGSDVRNRKKSLVVVAALESRTRHGRELASLYAGEDPLSDRDVARAVELIERAGARRWSQATIEALFAQAMGELERAGAADSAAGELRVLARLLTCRSH